MSVEWSGDEVRVNASRYSVDMDRSRSGLLGLAGEIVRHPALAEAVRARLQLPVQVNLAAMLARAAERGEIPPAADAQVSIALIVGPLHYWLLSGQEIRPGVVEMLVPRILRALGAKG